MFDKMILPDCQVEDVFAWMTSALARPNNAALSQLCALCLVRLLYEPRIFSE